MVDNPYESAMKAEYNPSRTYFGEVNIDTWFCVLVKGQGKIPFDPGIHSADQRCTAIEITIYPLSTRANAKPLKRELIAESREWAQIIKPSLVALNTDLRALNGRWVQVESVPTGQKYQDKATGELRDSTTFKFVALYDSEEACQKAADAFFASRGHADTEHSATQEAGSSPPNGNGANDKERETAAKFLPALWKASGGDVFKFGQMIASNQLTSKYFDLQSKEVLDLISPAA